MQRQAEERRLQDEVDKRNRSIERTKKMFPDKNDFQKIQTQSEQCCRWRLRLPVVPSVLCTLGKAARADCRSCPVCGAPSAMLESW